MLLLNRVKRFNFTLVKSAKSHKEHENSICIVKSAMHLWPMREGKLGLNMIIKILFNNKERPTSEVVEAKGMPMIGENCLAQEITLGSLNFNSNALR